MKSFERLLSLLSTIPDPRRAEGKLYQLPHILLFELQRVARPHDFPHGRSSKTDDTHSALGDVLRGQGQPTEVATLEQINDKLKV